MCGIAGIINRTGARVEVDWLKKISHALRYRGPDDGGFLGWTPLGGAVATRNADQIEGATIAFVHRRLSILDLSEAGWQPMQSGDRTYSIVLNGEIYNYIELRLELEKLGYVFHSQSDTEVLLKAYMQWGAQALLRLVGMFAFAILDLRRNSLFLARDFFGIKPLYYFASGECFGFASDTNTLLNFPGVNRKVNSHRLFPYLRFGITDYGEETLWRDIHQIPPAHYIEIPIHEFKPISPIRYWSIPPYAAQRIGYREASEQFREILLNSVSMHLRSDVPVGACLSGGLDSSTIVMAMRRLLGVNADIHTLSFISSDVSRSEDRWIGIIEKAAMTIPHRSYPSETDLMISFEDLVRSQGEPFGSMSIFAQYELFKLAKQQHITVMLDGQGADELLGGYWSSLGARIASLLINWRILSAGLLYLRGCQFPDSGKISLFSMAAGMLVPRFLRERGRKMLGRDLVPPWINKNWFEKQGIEVVEPWKFQGPYYLRARLEEELTHAPLPMLLRYEDRNSMRFSIESRVPFLTRQIAEFLLSLPEDFIIDMQGTRKSILRSAMRELVPDTILDRRNKIGFSTPDKNWTRALRFWFQKQLNSEVACSIPAFNIPKINEAWRDEIAGSGKGGFSTWRWINLVEWTRCFNVEYEV